MISVQSCRAKGPSWPVPIWSGQVSAPLRLNAQWWLLRWCSGGHGGVVINISPGLIPLVHKQRFRADVGTEHKGLWASDGNWAPQPLYYLRFVWPAAGVAPDEDSWAANKGTEQQNSGMKQRLAPREMVAEIWELEHGSGERHRALLEIDWEILLHCLKAIRLKDYLAQI